MLRWSVQRLRGDGVRSRSTGAVGDLLHIGALEDCRPTDE